MGQAPSTASTRNPDMAPCSAWLAALRLGKTPLWRDVARGFDAGFVDEPNDSNNTTTTTTVAASGDGARRSTATSSSSSSAAPPDAANFSTTAAKHRPHPIRIVPLPAAQEGGGFYSPTLRDGPAGEDDDGVAPDPSPLLRTTGPHAAAAADGVAEGDPTVTPLSPVRSEDSATPPALSSRYGRHFDDDDDGDDSDDEHDSGAARDSMTTTTGGSSSNAVAASAASREVGVPATLSQRSRVLPTTAANTTAGAAFGGIPSLMTFEPCSRHTSQDVLSAVSSGASSGYGSAYPRAGGHHHHGWASSPNVMLPEPCVGLAPIPASSGSSLNTAAARSSTAALPRRPTAVDALLHGSAGSLMSNAFGGSSSNASAAVRAADAHRHHNPLRLGVSAVKLDLPPARGCFAAGEGVSASPDGADTTAATSLLTTPTTTTTTIMDGDHQQHHRPSGVCAAHEQPQQQPPRAPYLHASTSSLRPIAPTPPPPHHQRLDAENLRQNEDEQQHHASTFGTGESEATPTLVNDEDAAALLRNNASMCRGARPPGDADDSSGTPFAPSVTPPSTSAARKPLVPGATACGSLTAAAIGGRHAGGHSSSHAAAGGSTTDSGYAPAAWQERAHHPHRGGAAAHHGNSPPGALPPRSPNPNLRASQDRRWHRVTKLHLQQQQHQRQEQRQKQLAAAAGAGGGGGSADGGANYEEDLCFAAQLPWAAKQCSPLQDTHDMDRHSGSFNNNNNNNNTSKFAAGDDDDDDGTPRHPRLSKSVACPRAAPMTALESLRGKLLRIQ